MADHDMKKVEREEEIRRRKKAQEWAPEKVKMPDEKPEANGIDAKFVMDTSALLSDARFAHSANAGQKARVVRGLQRSYGNTQVQRLLNSKTVQAKLTVNPPDDQYEKEADLVADAIARMPDSNIPLQLREEDVSTQLKLNRLPRNTQRQEDEEGIMMKTASRRIPEVSSDMETRIEAERGGGQPLPDSLRASLQPHLGHDLSEVRVHSDAAADSLAQKLEAKAFTTGQDVFFKAGAYQPASESSRRLIAHEMAHVVQQGAAPVCRKAAEPNAEKASTSKEEVEQRTKLAVEKKKTEMARAGLKGALEWAEILQAYGVSTEADKAMKRSIEIALETLQEKIAVFDPESAKREMMIDLLRVTQDVMALGGDPKAIESALQKARDWSQANLNSTIENLKRDATESAANSVAKAAGEALVLGCDQKLIELVFDKILDWAQVELDKAVMRQKETPTPATDKEVADKARRVYMLGGMSSEQLAMMTPPGIKVTVRTITRLPKPRRPKPRIIIKWAPGMERK